MREEGCETDSDYNVPLITVITNLDAITSPIVTTPAITEQNSTPLLTQPGENETGGQVNEQPDHEQEGSDKYNEDIPKCSPLQENWEQFKSPTVETPISPTSLPKWKEIQERETENDNNTNTNRNTTTAGGKKRFSLKGVLSSIKPAALSLRARLSRAISRNSASQSSPTQPGNDNVRTPTTDGNQVEGGEGDKVICDIYREENACQVEGEHEQVVRAPTDEDEEKTVETKLPIHVRVVQLATILLLLACLVVLINAVICVSQYKKTYSKPANVIIRNASILNGNVAFGNDMGLKIDQLNYIDKGSNLKMALNSLALSPSAVTTSNGDTFSLSEGNHIDLERLLNGPIFTPNSELDLLNDSSIEQLLDQVEGLTIRPTANSKDINNNDVGDDKSSDIKPSTISSLSLVLSDTSLNTRSFWFNVGAKLNAKIEVVFAENLHHCLMFQSPFCVKIDLVANVRMLYMVGRDVEKSIVLFFNDPEVDLIKEQQQREKEKEKDKPIDENDRPVFTNIKQDILKVIADSKVQFNSQEGEYFVFHFLPTFINSLGKSDFNLFFTLPSMEIDIIKQDDWNSDGKCVKLASLSLKLTDMTLKMTPDSIDHLDGTEELIAMKIGLGNFDTFIQRFIVEVPRREFAIRYANSENHPSLLGTLIAFCLNKATSFEPNKVIFKTFKHYPKISINLKNSSKMAEVSVKLLLPRICPIGTPNSIHFNLMPPTKIHVLRKNQKFCRFQWNLNEFAFSLNAFDPELFQWNDFTREEIIFTFKLDFYNTFDSWILMEFVKQLGITTFLPENEETESLIQIRINDTTEHEITAQQINKFLRKLKRNKRTISGNETVSATFDLEANADKNKSFKLQTPLPRNQPSDFVFDKWITGMEQEFLSSNLILSLHSDNPLIKLIKGTMTFLSRAIYPTDLPSHVNATLVLPDNSLSWYLEMNALQVLLIKIDLKESFTFDHLIPLFSADKSHQLVQIPFEVRLYKAKETEKMFSQLNWIKFSANFSKKFEYIGKKPDERFKYSIKEDEEQRAIEPKCLGYVGNVVFLLSTYTVDHPTLLSTLVASLVGPIETGAIDGFFTQLETESNSKDSYNPLNSLVIHELQAQRVVASLSVPIGLNCDWFKLICGKGIYVGLNEDEDLQIVPEQESPDVLVMVESGVFAASTHHSLKSISNGTRKKGIWKTIKIVLYGAEELSSVSTFYKRGGTLEATKQNSDVFLRTYKDWIDFSHKLRSIAMLLGGIMLNQKFNSFISLGVCRTDPVNDNVSSKFSTWSARQLILPVSFTSIKSDRPSVNGTIKSPEHVIEKTACIKLLLQAIKPIALRAVDLRFENIRIVTDLFFTSGKPPQLNYFDFNLGYEGENETNDENWLSSNVVKRFHLHDANDALDFSTGISMWRHPFKLDIAQDSYALISLRKANSNNSITIPLSLQDYPAIFDKVDANCTLSEEWPKDGGKEFFTTDRKAIPQLFASRVPRGVKISAAHSIVIKFQLKYEHLPLLSEEDWTVWTSDKEEFLNIVPNFKWGAFRIRTLGHFLNIKHVPRPIPDDCIITVCVYISPLTGMLEIIFNHSGEADAYYVTRYKAAGYYQMIKKRGIIIDNRTAPIVDESEVESEEEFSLQEPTNEEEQSNEKSTREENQSGENQSGENENEADEYQNGENEENQNDEYQNDENGNDENQNNESDEYHSEKHLSESIHNSRNHSGEYKSNENCSERVQSVASNISGRKSESRIAENIKESQLKEQSNENNLIESHNSIEEREYSEQFSNESSKSLENTNILRSSVQQSSKNRSDKYYGVQRSHSEDSNNTSIVYQSQEFNQGSVIKSTIVSIPANKMKEESIQNEESRMLNDRGIEKHSENNEALNSLSNTDENSVNNSNENSVNNTNENSMNNVENDERNSANSNENNGENSANYKENKEENSVSSNENVDNNSINENAKVSADNNEKNSADNHEENTANDNRKVSGSNIEEVSGSNIEEVSGSNIEEVSGSNIEEVSGSNIEKVSGSNIEKVSGSNIEEVSGSNIEENSANYNDENSANGSQEASENCNEEDEQHHSENNSSAQSAEQSCRQSSSQHSYPPSDSDSIFKANDYLDISIHFVYPDFTKSRLVWDTSMSSRFSPGTPKQLKFIHYDAEGTMVHLPLEIYCEESGKMQSLFSVRIIHKRLAKHSVLNTVFAFHSGKHAYQCGNANFSIYCFDVNFTHAGPYEVQLYEGTEKVYRKSFHIYLIN